MTTAPTTLGAPIMMKARVQLNVDSPPSTSRRAPTANVPALAAANPSVEYTAMAVPRLAGGATSRIPEVNAAESALMNAL